MFIIVTNVIRHSSNSQENNRRNSMVDATAGGRFVPEGITSPEVNTFGVDMNINNVVIFINFLFTKV